MSLHPDHTPEDRMDAVLRSVVAEGQRRKGRRTRMITGFGTLAIALVVLGSAIAIAQQQPDEPASVAGPLPTSPAPSDPTTSLATTTTTGPPTTIAGRRPAPSAALVKITDEAKLLAAIKRDALGDVTAYGLSSYGPYGRGVGTGVMTDLAATSGPMATSAPASPAARGGAQPSPAAAPAQEQAAGQGGSATSGAPEFSGTNNQEKGVDEADTVKTDGKTLFVAQGQHVRVVDVRSGTPKVVASVPLGDEQPTGLLLAGSRLLVFSGSEQPCCPEPRRAGADLAIAPVLPLKAKVRTVDVADPARPKVLMTAEIDGRYVDARLVGGVARLVTVTAPRIELAMPVDGSEAGQAKALEENRRRIRGSKLSSWLPPGTSASDTYRTQVSSGTDVVSVRSIDPATASVGKAVNVMTSAQTVYASTTSLYVATTEVDTAKAVLEGRRPPKAPSTAIHKLSIADPKEAVYVGSGDLEGTVLNQYSLSEAGDALRVATTKEGWMGGGPVPMPAPEPGPATTAPVPGPRQQSESAVTIFRPSAGALVEVGKVGGLGKGERIYAVRFVGDRGYVVTFRQVDPLYVIDLSDPTRPTVRGELKITGYSAYLHPIGDHQLLGVGVAASEEGRRLGFQVALFDVKDPANPVRLSAATIPGGSSMTEFDPHAFLWWEALGLAVIPVAASDGQAQFNGVVGYGVSTKAVEERGRISHPGTDGFSPQITRSVIVGPRLFTVSEAGVLAADAASLRTGAFAAFPSR